MTWGLLVVPCGIWFPNPGSNLGSLRLQHGLSHWTTREVPSQILVGMSEPRGRHTVGPVLRAVSELHEDLFALWLLLPASLHGGVYRSGLDCKTSLLASSSWTVGPQQVEGSSGSCMTLEMRPGPSFPCLAEGQHMRGCPILDWGAPADSWGWG